MKKQLLVLFASILFGVIAIVFFAVGEFITAVLLFVLAVVAWKIAKEWQRKNPIPMPYYLRWAMFIPRGHSPKKLVQFLKPIAAERLLEVGPDRIVMCCLLLLLCYQAVPLMFSTFNRKCLMHLKNVPQKKV